MRWKAVFIPASGESFEKTAKLENNLNKVVYSFLSISKRQYDIYTYFHNGTDWTFRSFTEWKTK